MGLQQGAGDATCLLKQLEETRISQGLVLTITLASAGKREGERGSVRGGLRPRMRMGTRNPSSHATASVTSARRLLWARPMSGPRERPCMTSASSTRCGCHLIPELKQGAQYDDPQFWPVLPGPVGAAEYTCHHCIGVYSF